MINSQVKRNSKKKNNEAGKRDKDGKRGKCEGIGGCEGDKEKWKSWEQSEPKEKRKIVESLNF